MKIFSKSCETEHSSTLVCSEGVRPIFSQTISVDLPFCLPVSRWHTLTCKLFLCVCVSECGHCLWANTSFIAFPAQYQRARPHHQVVIPQATLISWVHKQHILLFHIAVKLTLILRGTHVGYCSSFSLWHRFYLI